MLNIVKDQINQYKETIQYLIFKTDSILEFCLIPLLYEDLNLPRKQEIEIKRIVKILKLFANKLKEILKELNDINI